MLCCVGLIGGSLAGQALGGPWAYIGPAVGFGIGLIADMKLMHRFHQKPGAQQTNSSARAKADTDSPGSNQAAASTTAAQSGACCGVASGLARMFGMEDNLGKTTGVTPAGSGASSRTDAGETLLEAHPWATEAASTAQPATDGNIKAA